MDGCETRAAMMLCTPPSAIVAIARPTGPSHVATGHVTLQSGTTFEISGDGSMARFIVKLHIGDRIEACFGPTQEWADEPPDARMGIIVNRATRDYIYAVGIPKGGRDPFPQ